MGNVQKHRVVSAFFHFGVNGPCHHIPAGQILLGIVFFHESMTGRIDQDAALPPDGL